MWQRDLTYGDLTRPGPDSRGQHRVEAKSTEMDNCVVGINILVLGTCALKDAGQKLGPYVTSPQTVQAKTCSHTSVCADRDQRTEQMGFNVNR